MKAHLLYRDADLDLTAALPPQTAAVSQDLGVQTVIDAMAGGNRLFADVAAATLHTGLADAAAIAYRQDILRDCLRHPDTVRELYDIAVQAIAAERKEWSVFGESPELRLHRSVRVLEAFVGYLRRLRRLADAASQQFESEGFTALVSMLRTELTDGYFDEIAEHLATLQFRRGVRLSTHLGRGLKARRYAVRRPAAGRRPWREFLTIGTSPFTVVISDRDEAGARALGEIRARGLNTVSNVVTQAADHVLSFFVMLRDELAFYLGCLNLHRQLAELDMAVCFPTPLDGRRPSLSAGGIYDPGLALRQQAPVVPNDIDADGIRLTVITGANQGGKSTFLRALGLAHLMMHAGMFVAASSYRGCVRGPVFTHFKREEDATLTSGKLDEELARMGEVVEHVAIGSAVLMNESFSSTNESEGAEIGFQVITALVDADVSVIAVTHSFELASRLLSLARDDSLFLRADRGDDGRRPYRLRQGAPLQTSFGADLYRTIFGVEPDTDDDARLTG